MKRQPTTGTTSRAAGETLAASSGATPSSADAQQAWSGAGFRLHGYLMVMPLSELRAVERFSQVAPIAGTNAWVRGLAAYNGNAVTVVDPQAILYDDYVADALRQVDTVVVDIGTSLLALVVDELLGLKRFSVDTLRDDAPHTDESMQPYLIGAVSDAVGDVWRIFDARELVAQSAILDVVRPQV